MSQYVDKTNLPQYKYFNNMMVMKEAIQDLVSDALTGEMLLRRNGKKERSEGFFLLTKSRKQIAEFLYRQEEDQKRCRQELQEFAKESIYLVCSYILSFFLLPLQFMIPLSHDPFLLH